MLNLAPIMLIFLSVPTSIYCNPKSYDNYKVFRITPNTRIQTEYLHKFAKLKENSFWLEPFGSNPVDLQVAPTHLNEFNEMVTETHMEPIKLIDNIQTLIDEEKNTFDSRAGGDSFDFNQYHKLESIYTWMDKLHFMHTQTVHKIIGGQTFQQRVIQGVLLRFGVARKPGIFIEGGMHAREWISPATVVYLIDRLLNSEDPNIRQLAEAYDWYIFPVCNPDGYVYSHSSDRLWQKTVSDTGAGVDPEDARCKGVDLNRNFDYMWQEQEQLDTDPCDERYPGPVAFSELESKSLSQYIEHLSGKLFAYLSIHSYSQFLLLPFDYTNQHLENYHDALDIGSKAIAALTKRFGAQYRIGNRAEMTGKLATGTAMDWAKGFMKIDLAFTYKMRDTSNNYGYLLPQRYILRNAEEFIDSLVAMFQRARSLGYPKCLSPSGEGTSSGSIGCVNKSRFKLPRCFGGG